MSPDGVLHTTWQGPEQQTMNLVELVEYKCPATWQKKIQQNPGIYKNEWVPKAVPTRLREQLSSVLQAGGLPFHDRRIKIPCPAYYYAQVQFGMEIFRRSGVMMPLAHFVVWSPERMHRIRVLRDETYGRWLVDRLVELWKTEFAASVIRNEKKRKRVSRN